MAALFPILLIVHVALAVALLLPSILLPFLLRRGDANRDRGLTRALLRLQSGGTLPIAAGLAITGAALIALLGSELLGRPWLIVALVLYAANLAVAALISRPNIRRMLRITEGDPEAWRRRARRQRWVSYGLAATTGAIGFLMSVKPALW